MNTNSNAGSSAISMLITSNYYRDGSPCHLFVSDSLLISPVKEYKARENVNTPLRNESVFYSPSVRMDFKMDTPIESISPYLYIIINNTPIYYV